MKSQKIIINLALVILGIFIIYLFFNSYDLQRLKGQWFSGLDPHRRQNVAEVMKNKTNKELLRLIHNGDSVIAGSASAELEKRNISEYYQSYLKLLNSSREQTRAIGRALIWVNPDRAPDVLLKDIIKYKAEDYDYQQILVTLSAKKNLAIYPYIVTYSQEKGWRSAAPKYFEELGDPKALEILSELKKQVPDTKELSIVDELAVERLNKAIATLEAIKAQQENQNG